VFEEREDMDDFYLPEIINRGEEIVFESLVNPDPSLRYRIIHEGRNDIYNKLVELEENRSSERVKLDVFLN